MEFLLLKNIDFTITLSLFIIAVKIIKDFYQRKNRSSFFNLSGWVFEV